jgi:mediator of RNA polymerase II transcription subunit 31
MMEGDLEHETRGAARRRFEAELEFVQGLANPEYCHHLAQNLYFDDAQFRDYLVYLQYWRDLPYCLHIVFPHCLRILELLVSDDDFVEALKRPDFKDFLFSQQFGHWRHRATLLSDGEREAGETGGGEAPGGEAAGESGAPQPSDSTAIA